MSPLHPYPDILTVEEVCEALRMGFNAVYDLLNEGKLKAYNFMGDCVIE